MPDWVGCAFVELVMGLDLFGILGEDWVGLATSIEVRFSNCPEASIRPWLSRLDVATTRPLRICRIERLHLSQVILTRLIVMLGPGGIFLIWLDVIYQVWVTASASIIIVRHSIVAFIQRHFNWWVEKLALEIGLLRTNDHVFTILIRFEATWLACIIRRVLRELHVDTWGHEGLLILLLCLKSLLICQLISADLCVMSKTASYRVVALIHEAFCMRLGNRATVEPSRRAHHLLGGLRWGYSLCWAGLLRGSTWILGERNIHAVHFLLVRTPLRWSESVWLLSLFGPNIRAVVAHATLLLRTLSEMHQGLGLECLVGMAFHANTIICPLGSSLRWGFLHGRLGWFLWTYIH